MNNGGFTKDWEVTRVLWMDYVLKMKFFVNLFIYNIIASCSDDKTILIWMKQGSEFYECI